MGWYDDHYGDSALSDMYGGGGGDGFEFGSRTYAAGTRKCSVCLELKTKADFNKEEAAKPAARRCCNACGCPLPKDLSKLTVVQLKAELSQRGLPLAGLKGVLVERLSAVVAAEPEQPRPAAAPRAPRARKAPAVRCLGTKLDGSPCKISSAMTYDTAAPLRRGAKYCTLHAAQGAGGGAAGKEHRRRACDTAAVPSTARSAAAPAQGPGASRKRGAPAAPQTAAKRARAGSSGGCSGKAGCVNSPAGKCLFGCCGTCCKSRQGAAAAAGACPKHKRH